MVKRKINMKLYSIYTESHNVLVNDWFLPSLKDNYELVLRKYPQVGDLKQHKYGTAEFRKTMCFKVDLIIEAIKDNWGGIFIYSDVDIRFFQPFESIILKKMKGKDMIIQRDTKFGHMCSGFFAARGNEKNLRLWQDIRNVLRMGAEKESEQEILCELFFDYKSDFFSIIKQRCANMAMRFAHYLGRYIFNKKENYSFRKRNQLKNPYNIKWDYLPVTFFSPCTRLNGKLWEPGMDIEVPENIIMHHANGTLGVENKIAQFKYVKNIVNKRAAATARK